MNTKLFGHNLHPMLVVFPLGLLNASVLFDLLCLAAGKPVLGTVAYWIMAAGIVGALFAAPLGTLDWLSIPSGTRAKRVGLRHGIASLAMTAAFIACWLLRGSAPDKPTAASVAFSFVGLTCALIAGWLGGELIERLGISVHPNANPNAPSSLTEGEAQGATTTESPMGRGFGGPKPAV